MEYSKYGAAHGKIVVYFHGVPGDKAECSIFDQSGKKFQLCIICLDRFSIPPELTAENYYRTIAAQILKLSENKNIDVIGFSIGAFIAMQVCRFLPDKIDSLHLISAVAPLETNNYLPKMAGKNVFYLAKYQPFLFKALSYLQGLCALIATQKLTEIMFANCTGKDISLVTNPEFQSKLSKSLIHTYAINQQGYLRDIAAFVSPWSNILASLTIDTFIWHGEADNWAPKQMAEFLHSALPTSKQLRIEPGLSHYSCLYEQVETICSQLVANY